MIKTDEPTIVGTLSYGLKGDDDYIGSKVIGVLSPVGLLKGTIATGVKARYFEGPYVVTSKPHLDVQLPTRNKMSENDIVVKAIPFIRVNDDSGGQIAIIGKEV